MPSLTDYHQTLCFRRQFRFLSISLLALGLFLVCGFSSALYALPTQQLKPVGQGTMNWLWADIYSATLLNRSGVYQHNVYPVALSISYFTDIDDEDLISATRDEWERLAIQTPAVRERWLTQLEQIWPDIRAYDTLTFYATSADSAEFYHNAQRIGQVRSPQFSPSFLAIWLSDNSLKPALTRQLKGEKP
ncbi:chalcone isomerase family protein [Plesiomonas shigelloides]|uniref:chalcone isomerase family protein n=1 Tax=Plesiomonas shigelloides TaxID=703 RepID=UPI002FCB2348